MINYICLRFNVNHISNTLDSHSAAEWKHANHTPNTLDSHSATEWKPILYYTLQYDKNMQLLMQNA
jgi:hypothetical protein